jgi:hypothetical protein
MTTEVTTGSSTARMAAAPSGPPILLNMLRSAGGQGSASMAVGGGCYIAVKALLMKIAPILLNMLRSAGRAVEAWQ